MWDCGTGRGDETGEVERGDLPSCEEPGLLERDEEVVVVTVLMLLRSPATRGLRTSHVWVTVGRGDSDEGDCQGERLRRSSTSTAICG